MALESAKHGVRYNSIGPGYIETPMLSLLSDDASFITGANLLVDGGFTAGKA